MNDNYSNIYIMEGCVCVSERKSDWKNIWEIEEMCVCVCMWKIDALDRRSRERKRNHHSHPPLAQIPKLYYLPVLLIDSLLSTKKWYWSTMIIYVIIRPRCYRETVFNKNFIWTKPKAVSLNQSSGSFTWSVFGSKNERLGF